MIIYRLKDAKEEPRDGFSLNILAEIPLNKEVSSVGFFRPNVPPNGKLRNHYHEDIFEFMIFLNQAQIKFRSEIIDINPGDVVMISPGEPHEVFAGSEGTMPIVIKLPNNPKDVKIP